MANIARTIYVGVTSNLEQRVARHRAGTGSAFTARYGLTRLVYCEVTTNVHAALAREKQLKGWIRARKLALIESANPNWIDLAADWSPEKEPDPSLRSG